MSKSFKTIDTSDTSDSWSASKHVFQKLYNAKLTKTQSQADLIWSDCQWTDNKPDENVIKNINSDQTINYFPKACDIFRKDILNDNILKMERKFPGQFECILPKSWSLPEEYSKFIKDLEKLEQLDQDAIQYFIVKPNDEQRGCGIYIIDSQSIKNDLNEFSDCIVSKYIGNPLTIEGYKTDLRIHVLIASLDPLKIYIHKEGYLRLATSKYELPNLENSRNLFMHLTNWSLNKSNPRNPFTSSSSSSSYDAGKDFSVQESEGKLLRSLTHFNAKMLEKKDVDNDKLRDIYKDIDRIIFKTILASLESLKQDYEQTFGPIIRKHDQTISNNNTPQAFQLLGYDVMLDENYKPWFIEINHNPDLDDEPELLAGKVCRKLIADTIEIMGELNGSVLRKEKFENIEKDEYSDVYGIKENYFEELDLEQCMDELNRNTCK